MNNKKVIISAQHKADILGQDSPGAGSYEIKENALKLIK